MTQAIASRTRNIIKSDSNWTSKFSGVFWRTWVRWLSHSGWQTVPHTHHYYCIHYFLAMLHVTDYAQCISHNQPAESDQHSQTQWHNILPFSSAARSVASEWLEPNRFFIRRRRRRESSSQLSNFQKTWCLGSHTSPSTCHYHIHSYYYYNITIFIVVITILLILLVLLFLIIKITISISVRLERGERLLGVHLCHKSRQQVS